MAILSFNIKTLHAMTLPITEIDSDMTIKELVDSTVTFMEYPIFGDDQKEIDYFLENSKGERLSPDDTLTQAGVQMGELLVMRATSEVADPRSVKDQTPAPPGKVKVYVQLMDLSRTELETFDINKKVGDVLNEIIRKYKLPARDERLKEGKVYELFSKTFGRAMHENMTLRDAKIPNLDTFIVSTTEIPG